MQQTTDSADAATPAQTRNRSLEGLPRSGLGLERK
jgi:hypothetical protein